MSYKACKQTKVVPADQYSSNSLSMTGLGADKELVTMVAEKLKRRLNSYKLNSRSLLNVPAKLFSTRFSLCSTTTTAIATLLNFLSVFN